MSNNSKKNIATLFSVIILFLALLDGWEYGFFTILRFTVCATTAYIAWLAYTEQKEKWVWVFGGIAVLFNPFIPVYLNREIWVLIDLIIALFLMGTIFIFKLNKDSAV